jgi:hypothetical protein
MLRSGGSGAAAAASAAPPAGCSDAGVPPPPAPPQPSQAIAGWIRAAGTAAADVGEAAAGELFATAAAAAAPASSVRPPPLREVNRFRGVDMAAGALGDGTRGSIHTVWPSSSCMLLKGVKASCGAWCPPAAGRARGARSPLRPAAEVCGGAAALLPRPQALNATKSPACAPLGLSRARRQQRPRGRCTRRSQEYEDLPQLPMCCAKRHSMPLLGVYDALERSSGLRASPLPPLAAGSSAQAVTNQ